MKEQGLLRGIFAVILEEAASNPDFARRIELAMRGPARNSRRQRSRRTPALFDPVGAYQEGGEDTLRVKLAGLDIEQLKDIVADHGMDQSRLVMKWTTAAKIIDHIVSTSCARAKKGNAFRLD